MFLINSDTNQPKYKNKCAFATNYLQKAIKYAM